MPKSAPVSSCLCKTAPVAVVSTIFLNSEISTLSLLKTTWYKRALKESLLGKVYADRAKVKGVDQDPKTNEEIYRRYLKAFKKGVFNYIKEDVDRYTNEVIQVLSNVVAWNFSPANI